MTTSRPIDMGILIGLPAHPQMALDGLWNQALSALAEESPRLRALVIFVEDGSQQVVPPGPQVTLVALKINTGGRVAGLAGALSLKQGIAGIAGRLLRDNLQSRRFAKAVATRRETVARLCAADVVVSADIPADRAVWGLRDKSDAALMHGPFSMMAALRALIPTQPATTSPSINNSQQERT